ncbi:hypothetical protein NKH98_17735 [Mesorhizobium sp. M0833]|uniref:hypothetical protein n=1 Tax=Mesorhizobium sp. M0833 TaxID=2957009 RepID=UPI003337F438
MAKRTMAEILSEASAADGPSVVDDTQIAHSSVDPCGLRQTNFDLMNLVADGLNNVARHVRPFSFVSWAWRRALRLAKAEGRPDTDATVLEDFVARCEVIFAWSVFISASQTDLPGRQAMGQLLGAQKIDFHGATWKAFREGRADSTSLSAAVNYGPGLKALGWLARNDVNGKVLVPPTDVDAALDSFEARIADRLSHPAFSSFGPVTVTREEALAWAPAWMPDELTEEERRHAARTLTGDLATATRAEGLKLLLHAAGRPEQGSTEAVRSALAGEDPGFEVPEGLETAAARWRRLQYRQLFRYSVESLLAWTLDRLAESDGPLGTPALVSAFLAEAAIDGVRPASDWLDGTDPATPPSSATTAIADALRSQTREGLAAAIAQALALCIAHTPQDPETFDREDRLPLRRAGKEANARRQVEARELIRHAIETWAIAQHVYWAVGRGLQDARGGGKTILRLKLVMEEGGWTALPGRSRLSPAPTPDRIETAISLAAECGLLPELAA